MPPLVRCTMDHGVARLVLDRPQKRNALSRGVIEELSTAVRDAGANPDVRMLVLTGEGPVFCAGMDLGEMQARASDPGAAELWREDARMYHDLLVSLLTLPVPTLAVVQGPALAGGVGLVLACDLVLAAEGASFSLPEPRRGITAAIVSPLLTYRIGAGPAGWMLLSLRPVSAAEALRVGLCHEVASSGNLLRQEASLCDSTLSGAPSALKTTKQFLLETAGADLQARLDAGMQVSAAARETQDAREGLAAFLEKRPPRWARSEGEGRETGPDQ